MLRKRKSRGSEPGTSKRERRGEEEEICISKKLKEIGKGKRNDQRKIRSWDSKKEIKRKKKKKKRKGERDGGWRRCQSEVRGFQRENRGEKEKERRQARGANGEGDEEI